MPMSPPPPPPPPASLAARLQLPWLRHALAFALAVVLPWLLRAVGGTSSHGTGFLDFLALVLGFGLVVAGVLLYGWWSYAEWLGGVNRDHDEVSRHWRLGQGPTTLSRHPAWLAVCALVLGQALISMTPWLLAWAVIVIAGVNVLVRRFDEPELARAHGAEYEEYRARVARWLPWRGVWQMLRDIGQLLRNSVR
jgi:protein-S-isoprenylcysteine O-methyltransferase Ste14